MAEVDRIAASVDRCECGAPADDIHFDRSICACGMAHYYCNQCGTQTEACVDESPAATTPACSRCGQPWEKHYDPDLLKYKNGPFGTFGLTADHTPHIVGVHAPRAER